MKATLKQEVKSLAIYVIILITLVIVVDDKVGQIRTDINTVVRVSCQANTSGPIFAKYDDAIQVQIDNAKQAAALNTAAGDAAKAALNASTAARLRADLIPIPKPDCSKPLLP